MSKFQDYKFRAYLYGIATAVLLLLGGYGFITSEQQDQIGNVIAAVLNVGLAGATALAAANARPSQRDDAKTGQIEVIDQ